MMPCPKASRVAAAFVLGVATALVASAQADSGPRGDVVLEVGNGDSTKGTLNPASEVNEFQVAMPADAKFIMKAKGKKGLSARVNVCDPNGNSLATGTEVKTSSALKGVTAIAGKHIFLLSSRDGTGTGDYSFTVKWSPQRTYSEDKQFVVGGTSTFQFSAEQGSVVTIVAAASRGSAARPRLRTLSGGGSPSVDLLDQDPPSPSDRAGPITIPATGTYSVSVRSDGDDGEFKLTVNVTPPKHKRRKIDVSSKALGGDVSGAGEFAVAQIIGAAGGAVSVPLDTGLGGGAFDLAGSGVVIPSGAFPSGGAILVGTAKTLDPKGLVAPVGATVQFGPDGTKFSSPVSLTIPVDLGAVGGNANAVTIYTRDAKGKITEVPGPYDFITNPGFVTFPSSHFSAYVAAANQDGGGGDGGLGTLVSAVNIRDLSIASGFGDSTRLFFAADGTNAAKEIGANALSGVPELRTFAGGGTAMTYPTSRLNANLQGNVTAIVEDNGTVYIGTPTRVFAVDLSTDQLSVVFGTGMSGNAGDGGPGTSASISDVSDLFVDQNGDLLIVDSVSEVVRKLDVPGNASTIAGDGMNITVGQDGVLATATSLEMPQGITGDAAGNYYIAERFRVRRIDSVTGFVSTFSGSSTGATGCSTGSGAGNSRLYTNINSITFVGFPAPALFVTDNGCHAIYRIDATNGNTSTFLGTPGTPGLSQDGQANGPLEFPAAIDARSDGVIFFSEVHSQSADLVRFFVMLPQ